MIHDVVKDYYGKQLSSTADLKTSACCDASAVPDRLKPVLSAIHPEVLARYYGCGLVCPTDLVGARVLDLGCGTGRDVYALAQLVGASGEVVGVDMTPEQLAIAEEYRGWHATRFGFANVTLHSGYIERLEELPLAPGSFDVVVSNCVLNLSPDKPAVLAGVHRLLREGGEMYFSDVYADRRLPEAFRADPVAIGECLGGALYWNDFLNLARAAGFADPRLVEDRPLEIEDPRLAEAAGEARFFSATYRLFKLPALEPACEDFGQCATYRGPDEAFLLDKHHNFLRDVPMPVCSNSAAMVSATRFAGSFAVEGDTRVHRGLFTGCGGGLPFDTDPDAVAAAPCC